MPDTEKILVVGPAWVGDMVMAQALFMLLREQNPDVVIDVLAPAWSEPLLARMPEVRNTVLMPIGHGQFHLGKRFQIGREARSAGYDQAIVLPRSMKSALIPFFAGIPHRVGYRGEMRYGLLNDIRDLNRNALDQTVKRFVSLGLPPNMSLTEIPEPRLSVDKANRDSLVQRLGLTKEGPVVALIPGAAYGPAKCWPLEYFVRLTSDLVAAGASVWILGSESERDVGESIKQQSGDQAINLCGATRLEDTVDLLSRAQAAVTNDSGLMHVAAAAGTHVVALYGSTSPSFTPPLTRRKTIFYLQLDCSPCFQRECPLEHLRCLRDIDPAVVLADVNAVIDQTH